MKRVTTQRINCKGLMLGTPRKLVKPKIREKIKRRGFNQSLTLMTNKVPTTKSMSETPI